MSDIVFFDNNATTKLCDPARNVMINWTNTAANASGSSTVSRAAAILLTKFREQVQKHNNAGDYHVVITSGATESNCMIIRMTVDAYYRAAGTRCTDAKPHIITSAVEHKSIMMCLEGLERDGLCEVSWIKPMTTGQIHPDDVQAAIKKNTIMATIMWANNETGAINPIKQIAAICHAAKVPLHSDCVQLWGKSQLDLPAQDVDAISCCFHKLYGPQGIGLLVIRKSFVDGYQLQSLITGTQQEGLRGGTEPVALVAGAGAALIDTFQNRTAKNKHLVELKNYLIAGLKKIAPVEYYKNKQSWEEGKPKLEFCILSPPDGLPNTLLISIVQRNAEFCNVKFKAMLEKKGIVVSIGSACNTHSANASHVITAMDVEPIVKRGVLRISFGDHNTKQEVNALLKLFKF